MASRQRVCPIGPREESVDDSAEEADAKVGKSISSGAGAKQEEDSDGPTGPIFIRCSTPALTFEGAARGPR